MKSKKWIWVTLTILLTLVVLVGVAGAGFRMGLMQGANTVRNADGTPPFFGHMQRFDGDFNDKPENPHMQGFDHPQARGFDRGFNRGMRHGGFSPLFGLIHLILLGLLIWFGFKLIKNSGWRLTRVAPTETPNVEEKKE